MKLADFGGATTAVLLDVCTYPSQEPNSDPSDCVITPTGQATTLTLVKTVTNDNGGTKLVSDFPLFIDGEAATSGRPYLVLADVRHTASETAQPGYTPSVWGGDCAPDGTITLARGDNKTCTITNDDQAAT